MKMAPFEEIGIASLDHHRGLRQGASEVIYGAGKTPLQIEKIGRAFWDKGQRTILITRMSQEAADRMRREEGDLPFTYFPEARVGDRRKNKPRVDGHILVATGGTVTFRWLKKPP